jgi:predicted SAM-dependent methyltransferase
MFNDQSFFHREMKILLRKITRCLGLAPLQMHARFMAARCLSYNKWRTAKMSRRIWLELGSGAKKGQNGWITIDLTGADIAHDLRKGIPFASDSVDRIYTSHMLEHIPFKELLVFLDECYRVLKKDGELSVCVPDAGRYISAYAERRYFRQSNKGYQPAVPDTGSLLDQINYIAYMNQLHKYMFDEENLVNTLKRAPFASVELRNFDKCLDLKCRDFESIYAVAIK